MKHLLVQASIRQVILMMQLYDVCASAVMSVLECVFVHVCICVFVHVNVCGWGIGRTSGLFSLALSLSLSLCFCWALIRAM